jgi:hypothetical protein
VAHVLRRTRFASRSGRRAARLAAGLLAALTVLVAGASCGFDVQTNRPYTPAEGVNFDVGDPALLVRNLMILSREDGQGFLSATMTARADDALTAVAGAPIKPDSSPGTEFTVSLGSPVPLNDQSIVVLTNRQPLITVASPDLQVGSEAELTVTFRTAGSATVRVPIVDADEQPYATISPRASSSPTP